MTTRSRVLWMWLIAVVIWQAICYAMQTESAFYLDPRFTLSFLEMAVRAHSSIIPVGSSVAGIVILLASSRIARGSRAALAYFVFEMLYCAATVAMAAMVIASNLSPQHGFSARELIFPGITCAIASLAPGLLALTIYRSRRLT